MEVVEHRAQQALALAAALLGGGLALASLALASAPYANPFSLGLLACGGGSNLAAVVLLLDATSGLLRPRALYLGPSLGWLAQQSVDATWALAPHLRRVLAGLAASEAHNEGLLRHSRERHRQGLLLLVAALGGYALALAFSVLPTLG